MRGRMLIGIALALGLVLPATAHATASFELRYAPPVIEFSDDTKVKTIEDLRLRMLGANFLFQNPPAHFFLTKGGCTFDVTEQGYTCPRAGIERIVARMGRGDDQAKTSIRGYSQKFIGGSGDDRIKAGAGKQRLSGGDDDDLLKGGKGRDVLIGGPGEDTCRGGPGKDVIKSCE
jgi:RTX calcium-binding nonapeptide repeat (4 copies)